MDGPFPPTMVADIEKFFELEESRINGLGIYHDVFEVDTFFPLQRKNEMRKMLSRAGGTKPKVIMEIGADKGGSIYHWCKVPGVTNIIACEIRGTPYKHIFDHHFPDIGFCWLEKSSYEGGSLDIVQEYLEIIGSNIDVLFIDGDKSAFIEDFHLYQPLVSDRGLIFMHDIFDDAPKTAFYEVGYQGYNTEIIHDISEYNELAKRVSKGHSPVNAYENWLMHWRGCSCGVGVINPRK